MNDEWEHARSKLREAGVVGWEDLGRFVNNTDYFRPSAFDERAALPVLLDLLPTLTDRTLVSAVAGHLRRPWARPRAFPVLHLAFVSWAGRDQHTGWTVGDALATCGQVTDLPTLLDLAADRRYGWSRQMIVHALWRFKKDNRVATLLLHLIDDPDVALHAMGALRRVVGNRDALPHLRRVRDHHPEPRVREQAGQQVRRAEKRGTEGSEPTDPDAARREI
jgi:hypothetical protein